MPRYDPDGPGTNPVLAKTGQIICHKWRFKRQGAKMCIRQDFVHFKTANKDEKYFRLIHYLKKLRF